jgi:hypothetical protein
MNRSGFDGGHYYSESLVEFEVGSTTVRVVVVSTIQLSASRNLSPCCSMD